MNDSYNFQFFHSQLMLKSGVIIKNASDKKGRGVFGIVNRGEGDIISTQDCNYNTLSEIPSNLCTSFK